ncbi:MAG: phenylalanine--tRNA ligase subunit beta [Paracoccaceae bacterium]
MKFTLSWLKRHLDTDATLHEITDALTDLGLEVEGVEDPRAVLSNFTLGRVIDAERHPDADRLRVCTVETGAGIQTIVCGAPNARAGITAVIAAPGTYVPGIDTTIQVGTIRGVESHGMMASERELNLSDEHDGIIELAADGAWTGEVGQSFADWLAEHDPSKVDPVIEIAITPNRPDALGVRGIARDLAARGLGTMRDLRLEPVPDAFENPVPVTTQTEACPVFCSRVLRGVANGPSPAWLADRLRAIGLRPISFLVDVTNWATYDLARPLHVFDAAKVQGALRVHAAEGGETLVALDEKTYEMQPGMTVISDDTGVISIGGVMGGLSTGVSEATTDVIVEAAWFDPVRTAATGRALKINSDARYRFERGVDPEFTPRGLDHAVRMILDHAGGEASAMTVAGTIPDHSRAYRLEPARIESLVGMTIPESTQRQTLTALGFRLEGDMAHVPPWRPDVQGEADLVEEVARIASLTGLAAVPLPRPPGVARPVLTAMQRREGAARRTMAALGYVECVTYSFIDREAALAFGGADDARLANPISAEMSHMRPGLLPGLLRAAARNRARGEADMLLFEAGHAFGSGAPGNQRFEVAGVMIGGTGPKDVHGADRPWDVFDAKADAQALLAAMGAPAAAQVLRGADGWWHPGRSGRITLGPKKVLATFGELHPRVVAAMGLKGRVHAIVAWPGAVPVPRSTGAARPALDAPDLPWVERDFAFEVDAKVEAQVLANAAKGADKAVISQVRVFDAFEGGSLPEGRKSLALTVRLQPREATMTEAEIEAIAAKVVAKVEGASKGKLRG